MSSNRLSNDECAKVAKNNKNETQLSYILDSMPYVHNNKDITTAKSPAGNYMKEEHSSLVDVESKLRGQTTKASGCR